MTEQEQEREKKNKTIAFWSTAAIQVVVTLLLFVIIAWRAPDPPLPEYGIEINFGLDDVGSGDVQPETPVGNEGNQPEEPAQEEQVQPEVKEEVKEEPADTKEVEDEPVSKVESPVVVKDKEPEKPAEKPKEKVEDKKVEKQPEVKPKETPKPQAVFKPGNEQATTEKDGAKEGTPGNHGDDKGKTGDKGNPDGNREATDLYGQPGGGGNGVSMSGFTGFDWPKVQTPTLPDEAYGVYEFIVKVDADGTVIKVTPVKRGISLAAENKLKEMIQQLEFIPKGDNTGEAEGRITFKVVSK